MGRKIQKPKVDAELAKSFLDAAHGFDNSKPDCNLRTRFSTLVKIALSAGLVTPFELKRGFGFSEQQIRRTKLEQSIGVDKKNREELLAMLHVRAKEAAPAVK